MVESKAKRAGPAGRALRALGWTVSLASVVYVLLRAALALWAGAQLEAAEAAWAGDPTFVALTEATPRESNDSARELEALAATVGIDLRPSRDPESVKAERDARVTAADEWLRKVIAAGGGPVEPLPEELSGFLAARSSELDAILAHLATAEAPAWSMDVARGYEAPVPNLGGHSDLARLLGVRALEEAAAGRADRAAANLEGAWTLQETLASRPELICQLVRNFEARGTCAVVRRTRVDTDAWLARLAEHDAGADLRESLVGDAWVALHAARTGVLAPDAWSPEEDWTAAFAGPAFVRLQLAGTALSLRDIARDRARLDPCTGDPDRVTAAHLEQLSWWESLGRSRVPKLDRAWMRSLQSDLDVALTRQVLLARRALAAGADPPASVELPCATWAFRETRTPEGGFRIELDGHVPWSLGDPEHGPPYSHVEGPERVLQERAPLASRAGFSKPGSDPAPAEPPATRESARVPGDVRVLAILEKRGAKPRALVELRGGERLFLSEGDALGRGVVTRVSLDEALLELRETLDDPRLLRPWRNFFIAQWSGWPADLAGDVTCPTALARVEGETAVFRFTAMDGTPSYARLVAGATPCPGTRLASVHPEAGAQGVVILESTREDSRFALASWRP